MDEPPRHALWRSGLWAFLAAVAMLGWVAWRNLEEDTGTGAYSTLDGVVSEAERAAAGRLLTDAYAVLRSPAFGEAMRGFERAYPTVYARDAAQDLSPARIADIVDLKPFGSRYAPAQVDIVDESPALLAAAGEGGVSGRYSGMEVSRPVLAAYASGNVVRRSCAINVAAHEYAHTISLTPVGFHIAFTDTNAERRSIANRVNPDSPVASYLIGATAQCVWLSKQGRIGREEIPACVQVFGVRAFNWDRCGQFAPGEAVAPKPGLAREAPPL
ncbi:hypothetical protein [Phenylobacterium sp.]|uniref:hypothetical protein n=1 Tax=Phenylobacterium sp. TaxID=1871053 RepID=UPI0025D38148|nr:hypothetical protein [Phenylobacterium sp.]MBX3483030.1 hypothetical protein [Phenylobacterium sp.]